jgi:hypothetical protein
VTTAITGQLLPAERAQLSRPVTTDPIAYEEYLRGLRAANSSYDQAALRSALGHFDRAIARDSGLAAAFAGEADAWASLADGFVWPREGYGRARVAARRALSLDSSQSLPYATLALAALALDLDAGEAERLARRAVRLDPRNGGARGGLSVVLRAEGRLDESVDEARRAWETDSLSAFAATQYALTLIYGHRLDSAAALLPRLRAVLSPVESDRLEGTLRVARGDWQGAEPLLDWRWYGGRVAGAYVHALLARGDTTGARATVDSMLTARASGYYNAVALATAYTALGDLDRGFEWLQRAFEERTIYVALYVPWDDQLAPLRADPRYAALDRQLKY